MSSGVLRVSLSDNWRTQSNGLPDGARGLFRLANAVPEKKILAPQCPKPAFAMALGPNPMDSVFGDLPNTNSRSRYVSGQFRHLEFLLHRRSNISDAERQPQYWPHSHILDVRRLQRARFAVRYFPCPRNQGARSRRDRKILASFLSSPVCSGSYG